ncbi:MAG: class I SAM-dependent methyltransferase [Chitinispirillia bacterium]|nr:class I SAM-dependent methyltransferase [Chitinispirillia bacterium]MCL2241166.1 class I SAM-dependent methyltransferase [Chitinispirillia bacterium]
MQYDALAPMYDRLMFHVEYDEWVKLIRRVVLKYGASRKPGILELGAGTGIVGAALREYGYRYIATDLSPSMCKVARSVRGLPVCAADARQLPFKKRFDMALFLYDGINYMMTLEDYRKLFASVYDALEEGGLFLFDITTRENSVKYFSAYMDYEDYDDISFVRNSWFEFGKSVQHNDFTIFRQSPQNPGLYEKYVENHRQKVYSVSEIERSIPKKRFNVLGIWDGYTFKKYTSKSIRVHFLLEKI